MTGAQWVKISLTAAAAAFGLIILYFAIVSAISGFPFAADQFFLYWYFLVSLAAGFGVQIGLYTYLKESIRNMEIRMPEKTVAVTGTTSALAMISCCAHYAANIIPIVGIAGAFTAIAQYQIELFWVGLAFNLAGIAFIGGRIRKFKQAHIRSGI